MKFLTIAIVLFVAQGSLANPNPDPLLGLTLINNAAKTTTSVVSGLTNTIASTVNTADTGAATSVGTVVNTVANVTVTAANTAEATIIKSLTSVIPGVRYLTNTVIQITSSVSSANPLTLLGDVQKIVSAVQTGSTSTIIKGVFDLLGASSVLNTTITLPISASDTSVGDFFNGVIGALDTTENYLQNIITLANQTFTNLTDAGENFVTNEIGMLNLAPGSACWTSVNTATQNFVKALAGNGEVCIYNVINLVKKDIATIKAIQDEINSTIQTGKFRVGLITDIVAAAAGIPADLTGIQATFPTCVSAGLTASLLKLAPIVTGSASCLVD